MGAVSWPQLVLVPLPDLREGDDEQNNHDENDNARKNPEIDADPIVLFGKRLVGIKCHWALTTAFQIAQADATRHDHGGIFLLVWWGGGCRRRRCS